MVNQFAYYWAYFSHILTAFGHPLMSTVKSGPEQKELNFLDLLGKPKLIGEPIQQCNAARGSSYTKETCWDVSFALANRSRHHKSEPNHKKQLFFLTVCLCPFVSS